MQKVGDSTETVTGSGNEKTRWKRKKKYLKGQLPSDEKLLLEGNKKPGKALNNYFTRASVGQFLIDFTKEN